MLGLFSRRVLAKTAVQTAARQMAPWAAAMASQPGQASLSRAFSAQREGIACPTKPAHFSPSAWPNWQAKEGTPAATPSATKPTTPAGATRPSGTSSFGARRISTSPLSKSPLTKPAAGTVAPTTVVESKPTGARSAHSTPPRKWNGRDWHARESAPAMATRKSLGVSGTLVHMMMQVVSLFFAGGLMVVALVASVFG